MGVKKPANWDNDPPEVKRERKGYWMTGFGTGPDTTMGVLWGAALVVVASTDGTCHPFEGRSSGADAQSCVNHGLWNESFFNASGGTACIGTNILGQEMYKHDASNPACAAAFAAYRAEPDYTGGAAFTCNCSGAFNEHTFLGLGGRRPGNVFNDMTGYSLIVIAVGQLFLGGFADYSDKSLLIWKVCVVATGLCNFGMMALGGSYVWIIGLVFAALTAVFSEVQIPVRQAYMDTCAADDATRGYMGAMRQFSSYVAQLVYAIVLIPLLLFLSSNLSGLIAAGLAGVWYLISMPVILRMMRPHPSRRTPPAGANKLVLVVSELLSQFKRLFTQYPEAAKFLLAHALAQYGGPAFIILISTYLPEQLGRSSLIEVNVIGIAVLVIGAFATLGLAQLRKRERLSFKVAWIIVLVLDILIGVLVPFIANDESFTSFIMCIVLAGLVGGVALSWFYSLGWPCFIMLVPAEEIGAFGAIYSFGNAIVTPFVTIIYAAVVQATNLHTLAWGVSTAPFCLLSLLLMLTVNFEKGKATARRTDGSMTITDASTKTSTVAA